MTNNQVMAKLMQLSTKYGTNFYWNHNSSLENDRYSVRSSACTHHDDGCSYYGTCGCNSFKNSIQCHGFALHIADLLFGEFTVTPTNCSNANGTILENGWKIYSSAYFSNITLEPGDFIRVEGIYVNGIEQMHSAIVYRNINGTVTVLDLHSGTYGCKISIGTFATTSLSLSTESEIKAKAAYIVKAPKTSTDTTSVSVTFDTNGGSSSTSSMSLVPGTCYGGLSSPGRSGYTFMGWWPEKTKNTNAYALERKVPNYAHTLYAQYGKKYRIMCVGHMKCLTYDNSCGEIGNGNAIKLGTDLSTNAKNLWLIPDHGDNTFGTQTIIAISEKPEFGLSNSSSNCNLHRIFMNETNSIVDIVDSGNYHKIKLRGQNLYLTATAAASNAPVKWLAKDDSNNLQLWTFEES